MQACNQHLFKISTAELAQPRKKPFSSREGGVWA